MKSLGSIVWGRNVIAWGVWLSFLFFVFIVNSIETPLKLLLFFIQNQDANNLLGRWWNCAECWKKEKVGAWTELNSILIMIFLNKPVWLGTLKLLIDYLIRHLNSMSWRSSCSRLVIAKGSLFKFMKGISKQKKKKETHLVWKYQILFVLKVKENWWLILWTQWSSASAHGLFLNKIDKS